MARAFRRGLSHFEKRAPPPGSPPGFYAPGDAKVEPRSLLIHYGPEGVEEHPTPPVEKLRTCIEKPGVTWVDIQGLGSGELIEELAGLLGLHPLAVADIFHVPQRPKTEPYDSGYIFLVTRMPMQDEDGAVSLEQLSIFFGKNWVLTVQERYGDIFDAVRDRIRAGIGPIRLQGGDYLAYSILDTVIDGYFPGPAADRC